MMYDIKIGSLKNLSPIIGYKDMVIDRTTALGNPYDMNKDQTREIVIAAYRKYVWRCIQMSREDPCQFPEFDRTLVIAPTYRYPEVGVVVSKLEAIARLKEDIRLLCWCKQDNKEVACHGDVIKSCVLWMRKESLVRQEAGVI